VRSLIPAIALLIAPAPVRADPVTLQQFLSAPAQPPSASIAYGLAPVQGIDVYLPAGPGPHPLVILIHGGCWSERIPGREHVRPAATALAAQGFAVWSIGYRRADEAGGGYPAMFQDVAAAVDRARAEAGRFGFDLTRSVVTGHSAGGHLALWAANRARLPADSPAHVADPFIPGAVVALAGVGDLKAAARFADTSCAPGRLAQVTGPASPQRSDPFVDTSPHRLLPGPARVTLVSGIYDAIVPPYAAWDYAKAVRAAGQQAQLVNLPDSAHFDMMTPGTASFDAVVRELKAALAPR
jgi:acetyl esterase/lipase